jgi:hypothetical protein
MMVHLRRALCHLKRRTFSTSSVTPIVELREYKLYPGKAAEYMKHTFDYASVRHEHVPTRLFSLPETGGQLHVATHFYHYSEGYEQRDDIRSKMVKDERWVEYLGLIRPLIGEQYSTIFTEAPLVQFFGLHGMKNGSSPGGEQDDHSSASYEIRRYQLKLGYDTVPMFLKHYSQGLPSKLNAPGTDPTTSLVSLLYNDTGPLNEVIEIWRHGGGTKAMGISREAARGAEEWRTAISHIAQLAESFRSTIHKPCTTNGLSKWL